MYLLAGATRIELISTVLETAILTVVLRPYDIIITHKNKPREGFILMFLFFDFVATEIFLGFGKDNVFS